MIIEGRLNIRSTSLYEAVQFNTTNYILLSDHKVESVQCNTLYSIHCLMDLMDGDIICDYSSNLEIYIFNIVLTLKRVSPLFLMLPGERGASCGLPGVGQ